MAFNLTAVLQLRGPTNIRQVVSKLQKDFGRINVNINLKIAPNTLNGLASINKQLGTLLSQLNTLQPLSLSVGQSINTVGKGVRGTRNNIQNLNAGIQTVNASTTALNKSGKQTADVFYNIGKSTGEAIKRFSAFSTVTVAVFNILAALRAGITSAVDFQDQLVKIAQVTGSPLSSLRGLSKEVSRLATSLGVSSEKILGVSQVLAQAGLSANDVKIALDSLAKSSLAPTFTDIENTVEGAIAAMGQFGISVEDLDETLSVFNTVSARFAVESDDLITAVRRGGAAFKAAGGSLNEYVALFTSVRSTTRESAETIATGFRTIFTRIQRPKTLDFLKTLGIDLRTASGEFIGAFEAVDRLSKALSVLSTTDPRFAQIIEELGGYRQITKVIPLVQEFGDAQRALNVANRSGESLTRDAIVAQQSFKVQITQVKEEFFKLFKLISEDTLFQKLIQDFLGLAKASVQLAQSLTPLTALLPFLFAAGTSNRLASVGQGMLHALGFGGNQSISKRRNAGVVANPVVAAPTFNQLSGPYVNTQNPFQMNVGALAAANVAGFTASQGGATNAGLSAFQMGHWRFNAAGRPINSRGQFLPNQARNFYGPFAYPNFNLLNSGPVSPGGSPSGSMMNMAALSHSYNNPYNATRNRLIAFNSNKIRVNQFKAFDRFTNTLSNRVGIGGIGAGLLSQFAGADEDLSNSLFGAGTGAFLGGQLTATDRVSRQKNIARLSRLGLSRRQARGALRGANLALPIGGAAVGLLSSLGSKQIREGEELIAKGSESGARGIKVGGTFQGIGTGAGLGAAAGSIFGPVGAALGAALGGAIGGVKGFTDSVIKASNAIKIAKFEKAFSDLEKGTSLIDKGLSNIDAQSSKIIAGINSLIKGLSTTEGLTREEILARGESQLPVFENILRQITSTAPSAAGIGDLGNQVVDIIAALEKRDRKELVEQIQREIDERIKLEKELKQQQADALKLRKSLNDFVLFNEGIAGFSGHLEDTSRALSVFAGNITSINFGGFGGLSQGKINFAAFEKTALGLFSGLGQSGRSLGQDLVQAQTIRNILPEVLSQVGRVGALGTVPDLNQEVENRLRQTLGLGKIVQNGKLVDEPNFLVDAVIGALSEFTTDETGPNKFFDAIGTVGLQDFSDDLLKVFEPIEKAAKEGADLFSDILSSMFKNIEESVQLRIKEFELQVDKNELITQRNQEIFGFRNQPFGVRNFDAAENRTRQGLLGGVANNPFAVVRALQDINTRIAQQREGLTGAKLVGPNGELLDNAKKGADALADLQVRAAKLGAALERMKNPTERLAVLNSELERLERERLAKTDVFDIGVFGNFQERVDLLKNLGFAAKAIQAKNINAVPVEERRGVQQILERFAQFGGEVGKNAKKILDAFRVVQNEPVGVNANAFELTKEEQRLQAEIIKTYNSAIKAVQANSLLLQFNTAALTQGFDAKILGDRIDNIFRNNAVQGLQFKKQEVAIERNRLEQAVGRVGFLENLGIPFAQFKGIAQNINQIQDLAKLEKNLLPNQLNQETITKMIENLGLIGQKGLQSLNARDLLTSLGLNFGEISAFSGDLEALTAGQKFDIENQLNKIFGPGFEGITKDLTSRISGIASSEGEVGNSDILEISRLIAETFTTTGEKRTEERNNLRKQLDATFGENLPRILELYGSLSVDDTKDAVATINQTIGLLGDIPVESLAANIQRLELLVKAIDVQIKDIQGGAVPPRAGQAKGGRLPMAYGGHVRPQGADRVPAAMPDGQQFILQPGEYIVNAMSSRKHAALLDQINNDRTPLANGTFFGQSQSSVDSKFYRRNRIRNQIKSRKEEIRQEFFGQQFSEESNKQIIESARQRHLHNIFDKAAVEESRRQARISAQQRISNKSERDALIQQKQKELARRRYEKALPILQNPQNNPYALYRQQQEAAAQFNAVTGNGLRFKDEAKQVGVIDNSAQLRRRAERNTFERLRRLREFRENRPQREDIEVSKFQQQRNLRREQYLQERENRRKGIRPGIVNAGRSRVATGGMVGVNRPTRSTSSSKLGGSVDVKGLSQFCESFNSAVNNFINKGQGIADALSKIPTQIEFVGTIKPVEIIINGAEVLQQMKPELQELVVKKVNEGISKVMQDKFPKMGFGTYPNKPSRV